jgi:ABC-type sugar transport system permease subunit
VTRRRAWSIVPYLFIAPAIVGLGLFKLYPIMEGLRLSFYDVRPIARTQEFVGLANFLELVRDPVILRATWNTLLFNLVVTPTQIVLALGLAVLVNRKGKAVQVFRSLFFMPAVISLVVASIVWKLMYAPDSGLINGLLIAVGLPAQTFLTSQACWPGSRTFRRGSRKPPSWTVRERAGVSFPSRCRSFLRRCCSSWWPTP